MKKGNLKTLVDLTSLFFLSIILMPQVFAKVLDNEYFVIQELNQNIRDIREASNREEREEALENAERNSSYIQHIEFDKDMKGQDDDED